MSATNPADVVAVLRDLMIERAERSFASAPRRTTDPSRTRETPEAES